jgi:catechol 2,3-dioxygenase-like lactoylglutathione lyase family enzyme
MLATRGTGYACDAHRESKPSSGRKTVITGVHALIYSPDADADRAFVRDVLGLEYVDSGGGWLIFALPPAELAVHPSDSEPRHELYLMCDDVERTVAGLIAKGAEFEGGIQEARFGRVATIRLPSGAGLRMYEPKHAVAARQSR